MYRVCPNVCVQIRSSKKEVISLSEGCGRRACRHAGCLGALGPAAPIDEAVGDWRQSLASGEGRGAKHVRPQPAVVDVAPEQTLRKLVWDKVEPHLAGCSTVIVIPDGDLCFLPWAALPGCGAGKFLLEGLRDRHGAQRATAVRHADREPEPDRDRAFGGGVQFDASPVEPDGKTLLAKQDATKSQRSRAPAIAKRVMWKYLEGTADEVQGVGVCGQSRHGRPCRATRPRVKRGCATYCRRAASSTWPPRILRRRVVPLDVRARRARGAVVRRPRPVTARRAGVTYRNPLILSGVVLAGANLPPRTDALGLPTGVDGVLTGEEIANLDLHSTELAVLSAYDTGLGRVAGGEA